MSGQIARHCTMLALGAALALSAQGLAAAPLAERPAPRPAASNASESHAPDDFSDLKDNQREAIRLVALSRAAPGAEAEALLQRALALVPEPGQVRSGILCTVAADLYNSWADNAAELPKAAAAVDECNRVSPGKPALQMMAGSIKIHAGQYRAGGLLLVAAARAQPELFGDFDIAAMKWLLSRLEYGGEGAVAADLRVLLVHSGYGKDDTAFFAAMAQDAIRDSLEHHAGAEPASLLPQVMDAESGLEMLVDRRFQTIWPLLEQWSDGDLKRQSDARLAAARAQFQVDPALPNRRILAHALWNAGRHVEARALLKEAIDTPLLWDEDRFHIAQLTGQYAEMLIDGDSGARASGIVEAIAVERRIAAAIPVAQYPYAMNLMPNFANLLIGAGHDQEALELLERETPKPGVLDEPAVYGFYAALRYCALHNLGREAEARSQSALIDWHYATNQQARAIRTTCSIDPRSIESRWTARMTDPQERSGALVTFYRAKLGLRTSDRLPIEEMNQAATRSASLNALFLRLGRELPASYLPALRNWEDAASAASPAHAPPSGAEPAPPH